MACKQQKYPGRVVVLEYFIGCPDELPTAAQWTRLGSMRTKEYTVTWDTIDGTDSDSVGSIRDNIASFLGLSISGDGTSHNTGPGKESVVALEKHISNPTATGGQPTAWFRITDPRLTRTCYMLINEMQPVSAPYDDLATWSFSAMAAASSFGLIVEDTPDPDAPEVSSVAIYPSTVSVDVGGTYDLEAVVLPGNSPRGVTFSTSAAGTATVNPVSGLVTGVSAGTATITATSTADPTKTGTCAVTVTAP